MWFNVFLSVEQYVFLCIMTLVVIQISKIVVNKRNNLKNKYLPGLFPWPVIGNILSFGPNPHLTYHKLALKYGSIFKIKIGSVNAIVINDLATTKSAFCLQKSCFSCRPDFSTYKIVSRGQSVMFNDITTQGNDWKRNRAIIVRNLHQFTTAVRTRDRMNELITTETLHMITELDRISRSSEQYFNPEDVIRMAVANSVCAICFGKRFDYDNKDFCQLLSMNSEFGNVLTLGAAVDAMPWLTIFPKFKKAMRDYLCINKKLDEWGKERVNEVLNSNSQDKRNLVEALVLEFISTESLKLEDNDKETLTALIEDIFGAGQHSTSSTFFWVVTYLQTYDDVRTRIKKELTDVVGDRLPTLNDRDQLPYTEAFLHEVFRHSSLLPSSLPHTTNSEAIINGYVVPRGTMVIINQYTINHHPLYWDNPKKFNPNRFLSTTDGSVKLNSLVDKYNAFSIGTRKCPGIEMARQWLILASVILVQSCELLKDPARPPTLDAEYGLILKPNHLQIKLFKNRF